jgi:hypothetical protein
LSTTHEPPSDKALEWLISFGGVKCRPDLLNSSYLLCVAVLLFLGKTGVRSASGYFSYKDGHLYQVQEERALSFKTNFGIVKGPSFVILARNHSPAKEPSTLT